MSSTPATGEQGSFPGMPTPLYAASPSKLLSWLDCPRRYRFAYLDRPRPSVRPQRAHTSVGVSTHNALRDWWDSTPRTPQTGGRLLREGWIGLGFRDERQSEVWRERVQEEVTAYLAGVDPARTPVGVERTAAFKTTKLAFFGRIDRLDDRGGDLVVVDYKTGRAQPTEDDARTSMQLAMYAVAAERTLRAPVARVELHHIPTSTIAGVDLSTETRHRQLRRAAYTADDIDRAKADLAGGGDPDTAYPARPSRACGWCDFWAHCPEGRATTPLRDPWFAVPGEDSRHTP